MDGERMKLTKDMFEAGDVYQRSKSRHVLKTEKRKKLSSKQHKVLQNDEELMTKRENTPMVDEQNNAVIIWSISDNIFPKVSVFINRLQYVGT